MGKRYLIINADDFGMCSSHNEATFNLFECGGITSASLMVPCGWSKQAVRWWQKHKEYSVGVHLTFTSEWGGYRWGPVAPYGTDSLRDSEGYFHHECEAFEAQCEVSEVGNEIRAQISKAKNLGLEISHLDTHMAALYGLCGNFDLMPKVFELCSEYGYPFRMYRFPHEDYVPEGLDLPIPMYERFVRSYSNIADMYNVPILDYLIYPECPQEAYKDYETFKRFVINRLVNIPDGVSETYIHPSLETDEIKNITAKWWRRVWEYQLFSDPETRKVLESEGIELINYDDLVKIRQGNR
ncbi:MAG: polysaccharide deacetylase family protein [Clostridia bacterium]|nr:polysaccharide deacetylase family protein [Clostridia bacterium]